MTAKKRPKPTSLKSQERVCRSSSDFGFDSYRCDLIHAADTLKALREEVVPWMLEIAAKKNGLKFPQHRVYAQVCVQDVQYLLGKLGVQVG